MVRGLCTSLSVISKCYWDILPQNSIDKWQCVLRKNYRESGKHYDLRYRNQHGLLTSLKWQHTQYKPVWNSASHAQCIRNPDIAKYANPRVKTGDFRYVCPLKPFGFDRGIPNKQCPVFFSFFFFEKWKSYRQGCEIRRRVWLLVFLYIWATTWQNHQYDCAPS